MADTKRAAKEVEITHDMDYMVERHPFKLPEPDPSRHYRVTSKEKVSQRLSEGYRITRPEDVGHKPFVDPFTPTRPGIEANEAVWVKDMVFMDCPKELHEARRRMHDKRTDAQSPGVTNRLAGAPGNSQYLFAAGKTDVEHAGDVQRFAPKKNVEMYGPERGSNRKSFFIENNPLAKTET